MHYDFEQAQMDNYYISVESLCIFFVKKQINNDLHPNIILFVQNAEASYDYSSNDPFPYPRYTDDWFNR